MKLFASKPQTELELLEKQRQEIQHRIWELEVAERTQKSLPLVGKCFYHKWSKDRRWEYSRVLRIEEGKLIVRQIRFDITPEYEHHYTVFNYDWKPTTQEQWMQMIREIAP